jgi:hypothetical protein
MSCERKIQARCENVVKVIEKFIEGGKAPQEKPVGSGRWHRNTFLLKGLSKLEGQTEGKIWVVFAGWARVTDSLIHKVLSYNTNSPGRIPLSFLAKLTAAKHLQLMRTAKILQLRRNLQLQRIALG